MTKKQSQPKYALNDYLCVTYKTIKDYLQGYVKDIVKVSTGYIYLLDCSAKDIRFKRVWYKEDDLTKLVPLPTESGYYWIKHVLNSYDKSTQTCVALFAKVEKEFYVSDSDNIRHEDILAIGPKLEPPKL